MNIKFAYAGLLALTLAFTGCGKSNSGLPQASNDYTVETVKNSSADLNTAYPATFRGVQDIEVRPKISGFITRVAVKEGDAVRAGQVLFTIDSEQYRAAVSQAKAQISQIQANIATQELNVKNREKLNEKGVTSSFDLESAKNSLAALRAQLEQAKASLASAQDNLRWCSITAPVDGVIGEVPYSIGNLVSPSSTTALTTIANTSTTFVYFSITEKDALELSRDKGNLSKAIAEMPELTLRLADGTIYGHRGKAVGVSGVVGTGTGSMRVRVDFPNPEGLLRSGGTGSVLIPSKTNNTFTILQAATFEIQDKKFVYVVNADSTVSSREITVLSQNDGKHYIVTEGLKEGERIVTEGVNTLQTGAKITPITPEQAAKNRKQAAQDLKDGKM